MSPLSLYRPLTSCLAAALLLCGVAEGQYNERPEIIGSGMAGVDCSGRSIKNKRVRAVHTTDATRGGGTAFLFERDPFLAYQLGRNLNFREFRLRDGVFNRDISALAGPMPNGTAAKITANNHTSCSSCHNLPQGNPGGGTTFHKDSGFGRNAPHYYGAGIFEMLALQIRADILSQIDRNGDGWISASEATQGGSSVFVRSARGGTLIDFGRPSLSNGNTGTPALNNIFRVWYVDKNGRTVPGAARVNGTTTFGYNFAMIAWGWGQGGGRSALNPTNRAFLWDPFNAHSGLQAYDPSTSKDPDGDGVSEPTLAGAVQFPATHRAPDAGNKLHAKGYSLDDPDRDGHLNEISEGDLDLGEWFMLNAPVPAFRGTPTEYSAGVAELSRMGCTSCHVSDWEIEAKSSIHTGDRRFFNLDVTWNSVTGRLEGQLERLYTQQFAITPDGGLQKRYIRNFGSFMARGLFTDFKHHDVGQGFEEIDFGGTSNSVWRTPPLWGVGSGFPWGHDGQSLTIEDAILRHGGEALASRIAYQASTTTQRDTLLNFLRKLVLYDIETLPTDMDGDGAISPAFLVAGVNTGPERFNPEWLFRKPARIQGLIQMPSGKTIRSFAVTNVDQAYGQNLPLRRDRDNDGWPDVWDVAPNARGYKNGAPPVLR